MKEMISEDFTRRVAKNIDTDFFLLATAIDPLDKDEGPLGWWKTRRLEYPTLTGLVKKFLCVPATSTQAERDSSWIGWLLNNRRLCLSAKLFLKEHL